jgi:hypothetical protein
VVDRNGRLAPHLREQRARLAAEKLTFVGPRVYLGRARWLTTPRELLAIGTKIDE